MPNETAPSSQRTDTEFDYSQLHLHPEVAQEEMERSTRMRGSTVRLGGSGPRFRLGPVPPPSDQVPRGARPRGAGRPKAQSTRSSAKSGDSGDDAPSEEPPQRRLCENKRCKADITHLGPLARYCDNAGACKQQAYRDRRTLEHLDEIAGTTAEGLSCVCEPQRNTLEPGHCHQCGYTRGVVTRAWVKDPAPRSRQLVVLGSMPPKLRYSDGKRKPVTEKRTTPEEVAA